MDWFAYCANFSGSLYSFRYTAPLFAMQHSLDGFDFTDEDVGQGVDGFDDGLVDEVSVFGAGFFQHIIHYFVAIAGVADA